jgi:hypothetical protein
LHLLHVSLYSLVHAFEDMVSDFCWPVVRHKFALNPFRARLGAPASNEKMREEPDERYEIASRVSTASGSMSLGMVC